MIVSDAVEVKNGIYDVDSLLGCGVPDNSSTQLTFKWLKNGAEVHTDDHRIISLHRNPDYCTINFTKKGNKKQHG